MIVGIEVELDLLSWRSVDSVWLENIAAVSHVDGLDGAGR